MKTGQVNNVLLTPALLRVFRFCLLVCVVSCNKAANDSGTVRLANFDGVEQISSIVSDVFEGYNTTGLGHFTNDGKYPAVPSTYEYAIMWEKWNNGSNWFNFRTITAFSNAGDRTKAEYIRDFPDFKEVVDARLGKPPYRNVHALRKFDSPTKSFHYMMVLNQDALNRHDHVINLGGGYNPRNVAYESLADEPLTDSLAITIMLRLTEQINE